MKSLALTLAMAFLWLSGVGGLASAAQGAGPPSNEGKPSASPSHVFQLRTVVIDPGHGGRDPGFVSASGIQEKHVNLAVARQLGAELKRRGFKVVLLRTTDRKLSLEERGKLANLHSAEETLFISLHCNSWEDGTATGVETYVFDFRASDQDAARVALRENFGQEVDPFHYILGDLVHRGSAPYSLEAARQIQRVLSTRLHLRNRGVRRAPLKVLGYVQMPAVLVEMGFLSNPNEARQLQQESYQKKLASAIADGIQAFQSVVKTWGSG